MDRMMVSVAGGAMVSLVRKVGSLTAEQASRMMGVPFGIEWLKSELRIMQAFLVRLSDIEDPDEVVKCCKDELRELSYDMEDAIDRFMLHDGQGRPHLRSSSSSTGGFMEFFRRGKGLVRRLESRYTTAGVIRHLQDRALEADDRRKRYRLSEDDETATVLRTIDTRVVALYREALSLVGVDGPGDTITGWLMGGASPPPRDHMVVSIVGFGGIGKTTLAKHIFDKIKGQFDCAAFVSVSRKPSINEIMKELLLQFHPGRTMPAIGQLDLHGKQQPFIDLLRSYLQDKRYFVVVDDIWDTPTWEIIKCGLFNNGLGSRIITTTRIISVANRCSSGTGSIHKMEPLCYEDSKRLFLKRVFDSEVCPAPMETSLHNILQKCGGSPLAILTVSSLLVDKVAPYQWQTVCDSIGMGICQDDDVSTMRRILSHSYFDLPPHLRTCLLYLAIFPEDFVIKRKRLVHRWIAEGFVVAKSGENLTELGEHYFHELINRSLLQPVGIKYDGRASACRIHDTILDFIVSMSVEENFVMLLGDQDQRLDKKIRHLSIQTSQGDKDVTDLEAQDLFHIRSLTAFEYLKRIPSGLMNLRVLDLEDCRTGNQYGSKYGDNEEYGYCGILHNLQLVQNITELFHLKYLVFCESMEIPWLPIEFGNLQQLQTLDLRDCCDLEELPRCVKKLRCLVRLLLPYNIKLPNGVIGELKALEELKSVNVTDQSLKSLQELGRLTRLRTLALYIFPSKMDYNKELALVSSLNKLGRCSLRSLSIDAVRDEFVAESISLASGNLWQPAVHGLRNIKVGFIAEVPDWMSSLKNLEKINLNMFKMTQHDLDILGCLQNLLHLYLFLTKEPEETLVFRGRKRFQYLKFLHIKFCHDCVNMRRRNVMFDTGSTPAIKHLKLQLKTSNCYFGPDRLEKHARMCMFSESELANIYDFGIENLSSLTAVDVEDYCCAPMVAEFGEAAVKNSVNKLPNCSTYNFTAIFTKPGEY